MQCFKLLLLFMLVSVFTSMESHNKTIDGEDAQNNATNRLFKRFDMHKSFVSDQGFSTFLDGREDIMKLSKSLSLSTEHSLLSQQKIKLGKLNFAIDKELEDIRPGDDDSFYSKNAHVYWKEMKKEICERITKEKSKFFDDTKNVRRLSIEVFLHLGWKHYQESLQKINSRSLSLTQIGKNRSNHTLESAFNAKENVSIYYQHYHGYKLIDLALKKIKDDGYKDYENEFQNFSAIYIKNFTILPLLESYLDEYAMDENPSVFGFMERSICMTQQTAFIDQESFISQFTELTSHFEQDDEDGLKQRHSGYCFCVIV